MKNALDTLQQTPFVHWKKNPPHKIQFFYFVPNSMCFCFTWVKASIDLSAELTLMNCSTRESRDTNYLVSSFSVLGHGGVAQAFALNQQMAQEYILIMGEVENFKLREEDEKLYCPLLKLVYF